MITRILTAAVAIAALTLAAAKPKPKSPPQLLDRRDGHFDRQRTWQHPIERNRNRNRGRIRSSRHARERTQRWLRLR